MPRGSTLIGQGEAEIEIALAEAYGEGRITLEQAAFPWRLLWRKPRGRKRILTDETGLYWCPPTLCYAS